MVQIGSYICKGVDNLRIKKFGTNEVIDSLRHLKTSDLSNTGEIVPVKGGKGNKKIYSYTANKESKITFSNATRKLSILEMQTGNQIIEGARDVDITEIHTIATNSITLEKTIKGDPSAVFVDGIKYTKATAATPSANEYKLASQVMTFATGVTGVAKVEFVSSVSSTKTVKQTGDSESITCSLSADLLLVDVNTNRAYIGQFQAKSAKLGEEFNVTATNEAGEPEPYELPFDLNEVEGYPTWELIIFED